MPHPIRTVNCCKRLGQNLGRPQLLQDAPDFYHPNHLSPKHRNSLWHTLPLISGFLFAFLFRKKSGASGACEGLAGCQGYSVEETCLPSKKTSHWARTKSEYLSSHQRDTLRVPQTAQRCSQPYCIRISGVKLWQGWGVLNSSGLENLGINIVANCCLDPRLPGQTTHSRTA